MATPRSLVRPEPVPNGLEWSNIDGEKTRTYHYPDKTTFTVSGVIRLCVRPSENHRLETKDGKKWIVKGGWIAIEAEADRWSA